MGFPTVDDMTFVSSILACIMSFLVYLAPLPTFYRIVKGKSSQGFDSVTYSVSLFSAMLCVYYAFIKGDSLALITINCVGSATEIAYLIIFIIYATNKTKICTAKLLILFNFGAFGVIVGLTYFLLKGEQKVSIVGWICAIFSVCVFVAPLSIMKEVIKTKSVEFMPFNLSIFLTVSAVMWFIYGVLTQDYYIATPNVLGFTFGIAQMVLYGIYKNGKKQLLPEVHEKEKAIGEIYRTSQDIVMDVAEMEKQHKSELETESNHPKNEGCIRS